MAELVTGMLVGPLVSMVQDKASSYLLGQYELMDGMEEQHKNLKRKFLAILDVIAEAEEQAAAHREGAKAWLEDFKTVAYEANEVFNEFKYEALRREAKKKGHYSKLGFDAVKLFPTHNRIVFRYRMGNKLRGILQAIEVLWTEMNAFRFVYRPQPLVLKHWRYTDSVIIYPDNIASRSRDEDKQEIVKKLFHPANPKELTILPIVGMGGLGKTTLAQLIYNDPEIGEHFQLLPWVCVSDNFDVDFVAKSIVEAAPKVKDGKPKKGVQEQKDVTSSTPLDKLQNLVSGQRYLLVLDDIWKHDADSEWEDKWEKLKTCLQHGGDGSAVLTTTRDQRVANLMGTVKTHDLTALENEFIKEIIMKRAFSLQKEKERLIVLVDMVDEIVNRCAGSPLAAKALGSVLRTKTSVEEWEAVLRKSSAYIRDTEIFPILKFSYDDLPSLMKQCFAFCALFPKDYEIDVEMLIQLWMANSLIPEEKGVRLETIGRNIFNELASRAFFQDVKRVPFGKDKSKHGYCSRIICKMHDLMHDVASSIMEKECVTITENPSPNELFPNPARHVFLSYDEPEAILNDSLKKRSPAIQTLLCDKRVYSSLQHLSKYSSVRALHLEQHESAFLLKPKHLHHLRYLDLSDSGIKTLPEDISILYNLQTLNLSGCYKLRRLPKHMKYTALRHLYTHGCPKLKSMPPDLGQLTSLQTLTCFVVGDGSDCSNLGELRHLNLGGRLELHQLENVTEADAKAANLRNKKELTELTLIWANREEEEQHYHKVLEGLEPHGGLQALKICESRCFPTWISMLKNLVELCLSGCEESHRLPPLWKLPELRVLCLAKLKKLQCLCSCDTPFTFLKLKELELDSLLDFERWRETNERLEGQLLLPQLEKLLVNDCKKLTALPEAPPLGDHTTACSAFPELKNVKLYGLTSFKSWGATGGTDGEHPIFPNLESLHIRECPELTALPEAPKLSVSSIQNGNQHIFPWAARYMTSLTNLNLEIEDTETTSPAEHSLTELVDGKEKWNHKSPLTVMELRGCNLFFRSGALALWTCFVQLHDLEIRSCDALVHWPEKEFQSLGSLRRLIIRECKNLTGYAQAPEQSASESSQLLPRLESLEILSCESLVEVFNVPASLRAMYIAGCNKLESIFGKQLGKSALIKGSCSEVMASTSVPESSSSAREHFLPPRLQSLYIESCDSLTELPDLPQSIKGLYIVGCSRLKSLKSRSGELPSLEHLSLVDCKTLASLPDGPQAYSSLRWLVIRKCPAIKTLPRSLKERLGSLQCKVLDGLYEGPRLLKPKTWKYVIRKDE